MQVSVTGVSGYGVPTGSVTITDSINGGPTNNVTTVNLDSNGNGYLVSGAIRTLELLSLGLHLCSSPDAHWRIAQPERNVFGR